MTGLLNSKPSEIDNIFCMILVVYLLIGHVSLFYPEAVF